ncbi:MAG: hypothetical protein R2830_03880 [Saprospiraceae bacterium]
MNSKISISEALQKIEAGQPVSGYSIDFNHIKVEALDVMKLTKAGIAVPETAIYYNDDDTQFDEDFEGNWVRTATPPSYTQTAITINLKDDIKQWAESNHVKLDQLLEHLLDGFYRAQKMVSEK